MSIVTLDYETRSPLDIERFGLDNYCRKAEILMLGYAIDDEPAQIWLPDKPFPDGLRQRLEHPDVLKISWNASFERLITRYCLGINIPINQWRDPSVLARNISLPGSLESVCDILKITDGKIADGKRLIQIFSIPNGRAGHETLFGIDDGWNPPEQFLEDWNKFIAYCIRDVEIERKLWFKLKKLFPENHWKDWFLDQEINEYGIPINLIRARKALSLAERFKSESAKKLNELTRLENANSRDQLLPWLKERGYSWGSIEKKYVETELKNPNSLLTDEARKVLDLRQKSAQNSYKKLERILDLTSPDGRLRYQFLFMGASRTGRWSSSGAQVQNLPRPIKAVKKMLADNPDELFRLIDTEAYEEINQKFGGVLPFVSSILRNLFEVTE